MAVSMLARADGRSEWSVSASWPRWVGAALVLLLIAIEVRAALGDRGGPPGAVTLTTLTEAGVELAPDRVQVLIARLAGAGLSVQRELHECIVSLDALRAGTLTRERLPGSGVEVTIGWMPGAASRHDRTELAPLAVRLGQSQAPADASGGSIGTVGQRIEIGDARPFRAMLTSADLPLACGLIDRPPARLVVMARELYPGDQTAPRDAAMVASALGASIRRCPPFVGLTLSSDGPLPSVPPLLRLLHDANGLAALLAGFGLFLLAGGQRSLVRGAACAVVVGLAMLSLAVRLEVRQQQRRLHHADAEVRVDAAVCLAMGQAFAASSASAIAEAFRLEQRDDVRAGLLLALVADGTRIHSLPVARDVLASAADDAAPAVRNAAALAGYPPR